MSKVPGVLEAAVARSVSALSLVAAEGARAGVNTAAACAPPLRAAFFEAFTTFAVAMDKVLFIHLLVCSTLRWYIAHTVQRAVLLDYCAPQLRDAHNKQCDF